MAFSRLLFLLCCLVFAVLLVFVVAQDDDEEDNGGGGGGGGGGMLANCQSDDDCEDPLRCAIYRPENNNIRLCARRERCFCYAQSEVKDCVRAVDDCDEGYQCFTPRFLDSGICSVCEDNFFNVVDVNNNCDASIPPPTPSNSPSESPTPSPTESTSPTVTPSPSVTLTPSPSAKSSLLDPLESPTPDGDLLEESPDGDPTPSSTASPPVSPSASKSPSAGADPVTPSPMTPSPSSTSAAGENSDSDDSDGDPTEDPICVDAKLLSHLTADQLVFPKHRRTSVLCDSFGSCATPGHVVVHNGRPMMMKSYCAVAGCTRTVKLVNSPRLSRGIRVPTLTKNLDFTALAARYESRAEETVLKALVHMGV